eukprot:1184445-Prorocentrum_minimum.AAC.4
MHLIVIRLHHENSAIDPTKRLFTGKQTHFNTMVMSLQTEALVEERLLQCQMQASLRDAVTFAEVIHQPLNIGSGDDCLRMGRPSKL